MPDKLTEKDLQSLDKQTLITMLLQIKSSYDGLSQQIALLTEQLGSQQANRFGRSSESHMTQIEGQLSLSFNEAEVMVDLHPDLQEPTIDEVITVKEHKRTARKAGKRDEDLKDLPRVVEEHYLTEEELREVFPDGKWKQLPDEVYCRLNFHPATFEVVEHHVGVYAGSDTGEFIRGDRSGSLFRNSIATPSLVAGILNFKFVNSMPVERLAREFENNDVHILPQTMCHWVILSADRYLGRLYERMKQELFRYHVIHADETPVKVVKDGRDTSTNSYMWVYRSGALEPHPFVLYEYQKTRKSDHPREFLKDFKGICVTDGYQVYHTIAKERKDLKIAGCWAHARRKFADAVKAMKGIPEESKKGSDAYKALQIIQSMYLYENSYAEMTAQERLSARRRQVSPLIESFFAWIRERRGYHPAKGLTGKAITYCLNQEEYLKAVLEDGYVPMDNNAAERGIRTFCLGKKNWYTIDTTSGARASAIHYSIAESARANNLKPYEYFKYLLEELMAHQDDSDLSYLDRLLPWAESLPDICKKPPASAETKQ